jgi:hypothetical protein
MNTQQYEFLAKETIGGIKFSSNAARENFYQKLIEKNLPVENQKLLGFDDYLNEIKTQDPGAFVVEQSQEPDHPIFADGGGQKPPDSGNKNSFNFNFTGIRKHE